MPSRKREPLPKVQKLNPPDFTVRRTSSPRIHESRNLSRKTEFKDENGETIVINYDDLTNLKLLGSGQYGIVSKYLHKPTNKIFAMKRINNSSSENDQNEKNELKDLDIPLKTGDCPYTVKFYGAMFAEGFIWILTECMDAALDKFYITAHKLNKHINEVFLSRVAFSVLSAVDYLKRKDIMHRDVKPSNILINYNGDVKLCDFGICGYMKNSICITKEKGCRPYMSPEKINTESHGYSVKADIWSLAISLIEIATGKHPYSYAGNYYSQVMAICEHPSPKLPENYSIEFQSFIDKSLIKDPEERGGLELLEHPFIINNLNKGIDLNFSKQIIDQIQEDNAEN